MMELSHVFFSINVASYLCHNLSCCADLIYVCLQPSRVLLSRQHNLMGASQTHLGSIIVNERAANGHEWSLLMLISSAGECDSSDNTPEMKEGEPASNSFPYSHGACRLSLGPVVRGDRP